MGWNSDKYPSNWNSIRKRVLKRDGYKCTKCGTTNDQLHVHHIKPISQGGSHSTRNLKTLCHSCHEKVHGHRIPTKGNSSPSKNSGISWTGLGIQNIDKYIDVDEEEEGDLEDFIDEFRRENSRSFSDWIGRLAGGIVGGTILFSPYLFSIFSAGPVGIIVGIFVWLIFMLILGIPLVIFAVALGALTWITTWGAVASTLIAWKHLHYDSFESMFVERFEEEQTFLEEQFKEQLK